mgnify:CR=1 FL=1
MPSKNYIPQIPESVGTDNLVISKGYRLGSQSLDRLYDLNESINSYDSNNSENQRVSNGAIEPYSNSKNTIDSLLNHRDDFYFVYILRDAHSRWTSGYVEELWHKGFVQEENELGELDKFEELHRTDSDLFWMWSGHANFLDQLLSLEFALCSSNVYFLDLKNLSNKNFLEWCRDKDNTWNEVENIPYDNKTPRWKEEIVLEAGKKLSMNHITPFILTLGRNLNQYLEYKKEQAVEYNKVIKFIQENHDRYISL